MCQGSRGGVESNARVYQGVACGRHDRNQDRGMHDWWKLKRGVDLERSAGVPVIHRHTAQDYTHRSTLWAGLQPGHPAGHKPARPMAGEDGIDDDFIYMSGGEL
eukprot:TRINITY_DN7953_c0_g1_i1.p6 TRINITY_DN7953_c0_g1~~TRINITY_DN7953_c0_g1_i1.p6  ORF type:complete len:104 (-),score=10.97 TRINITY_DN7953_c0_g1_i1:775-1086(-)